MIWLVLALALLGRSHPVSPLQAACDRIAQAGVMEHASAAECYRCESHGSVYMLFLTNGDVYACDNPRW